LPRVLKEMCFEVRIGNSFLNPRPLGQLPTTPKINKQAQLWGVEDIK